MKVTLVGYTPRPLYVCAEAAATCYNSEPSLKIIKGCIKSGHQSVLEHCSFTFKVEGISRACSHQLVRHRIASYSQQSQRYVTYDNLDWVTDGLEMGAIEATKYACDEAMVAYREMIDSGIKAENARAVLPNATPTIIYVTMNLRSLMHFCNERMCSRAQTEIRNVAMGMKEQIMCTDQITFEEKVILDTVLVPKCMAGPIKACPERDGCGRYKPLKEFAWRPTAKWVASDVAGSLLVKCSNCGFDTGALSFNFCPSCGATMAVDK